MKWPISGPVAAGSRARKTPVSKPLPCRARSDLNPSRIPAARISGEATTPQRRSRLAKFRFRGSPNTTQPGAAQRRLTFCCIASKAAFPQASRMTFACAVRVVFCTLRNTLPPPRLDGGGQRHAFKGCFVGRFFLAANPPRVASDASSTRSRRGYPVIVETVVVKARWKLLSIRSFFNRPAWVTPSA